MFIRTNTKLQTTIFNLELFSTKEKLTMFKELITKSGADMQTTNLSNTPTFLSGVSIIPPYDANYSSSSRTTQSFFYHDIVGIKTIAPRLETMYSSKIFNTRGVFTQRSIISHNTKGKDTITIKEQKTNTLLHKYNAKELKELSKRNTLEFPSCGDGMRNVVHGYGNRNEENYLLPVIEEVDHLMIIEGVSTLTELGDLLTTYAQLGINFIHRIYGLSMLYSYLDSSEHTFNLENKYGIPIGEGRKQFDYYQRKDRINNYRTDDMSEYTSLFFENINQQKLKNDELNLFIPFKIFVFLTRSFQCPLFKELSSITTEEAVIETPSIFSPQRVGGTTGLPRLLSKEEIEKNRNQKPQTTTTLLPDLTTSNYKLKNTLTYVPPNLCSRLLKSKLKLLENKSMSLYEQADRIYNIPKSVLDNDYMSDFHFFSAEQIKEINKAVEDYDINYYFNIASDGSINLSYYTNNIHNKLLNRFASKSNNSNLTLRDFITCPELIFGEGFDIDKALAALENRQVKLAKIFNSEKQTILTREMFLYEKAELVTMYILKRTLDKVFDERKGTNSNTDSCIKEFKESLKKNHNHLSRSVMERGYVQGGFINITPVRKAYLLETLYIACSEKDNIELITFVEDTIKDAFILISRRLDSFIRTQRLAKQMTSFLLRTNLSTKGLNLFTMRYFDKYTIEQTDLSKTCFILSQTKSKHLSPQLLADIVIINFAKNIRKELEMLIAFILKSDSTHISSVENKIKLKYLANSKYQDNILASLRGHMSINHHLTTYPMIFKTLGECGTSKNDDLEVFISMLLKNCREHYFSSIKM